VVNAGPGEQILVNELLARARVTRPLCFHLSLRQLIALIRRARVVVSGDTGPLHLAAALGTPAVGLYGPTDPVRNGPYGVVPARLSVIHHRELSTITYRHHERPDPAILAITVEEVLEAVAHVVEAPHPSAGLG
jgi:heptosyltransferase-1